MAYDKIHIANTIAMFSNMSVDENLCFVRFFATKTFA